MSAPSVTPTGLLLLGLLLDRPMHGYELHQRIEAEGIADWFKVSMAGVYYALDRLLDQGLVAGSGAQRGRGSARKAVYRLTEAGRGAFFEALETQAASRDEIYLDYDLVIYLLNRLPLRRAVSLLEQRQALLAEQVREVRVALETERRGSQSPLKLALLDHRERYLEMEGTWLHSIMRGIQDEDHDGQAEEGRALMSLSGDLGHQHLPDLIRFLASSRHSGRLSVTRGPVTCTLGFERGQPTGASYQCQGEPPARLSPQAALEAVCELFRWQEGRFTLDQERPCEEWCVPLDLSAKDLVLAGCRTVDDWSIIQRLVPSADMVFEPGSPAPGQAALALTPNEEQILAALDGVKSVASIAQALGLTVFAASRVLYALAAVDMVRVASLDKIRLRRAFGEIAGLLCHSTLAWRSSENDTCEQQVNERCGQLPLRLHRGQIEDQTSPETGTEELVEMYRQFLLAQLEVIGQRFGPEKARQAFDQTLHRLAPELQGVARQFGFDTLAPV